MMMPDDEPLSEAQAHWHLDRRIPIALLLGLVLQSFAIAWWASDVSARVTMLERHSIATAPQGDRLTRVEVRIEAVQGDVTEIKSDIKRLIRREP
jgi:hypothetical protein